MCGCLRERIAISVADAHAQPRHKCHGDREWSVSDPPGLTPLCQGGLRGFFLTHPRARPTQRSSSDLPAFGLVPRVPRNQFSAREKRWDKSNTGQLDVT